MARKKKLSPSGAKDESGDYHNVHLNIHEDELAVAGMNIGDEVFVVGMCIRRGRPFSS